MLAEKIENYEEQIDVQQQSLDAFQFQYFVASSDVPGEDLHALLEEIKGSPLSHYWKYFDYSPSDLQGLGDRLANWERQQRPTRLFFYFGVHESGGRELVGAGTVAEKVNALFPQQGFPSLSRTFIRKKFAGHRFYFPTINHRLRYCNHNIPGLNAVHMNSGSQTILACIKYGIFGLPFCFVGSSGDKNGELQREFLFFNENSLVFLKNSLLSHIGDVRADDHKDYRQFVQSAFDLMGNKFDSKSHVKLFELWDRLPRELFDEQFKVLMEFLLELKLKVPSDTELEEESEGLLSQIRMRNH